MFGERGEGNALEGLISRDGLARWYGTDVMSKSQFFIERNERTEENIPSFQLPLSPPLLPQNKKKIQIKLLSASQITYPGHPSENDTADLGGDEVSISFEENSTFLCFPSITRWGKRGQKETKIENPHLPREANSGCVHICCASHDEDQKMIDCHHQEDRCYNKHDRFLEILHRPQLRNGNLFFFENNGRVTFSKLFNVWKKNGRK